LAQEVLNIFWPTQAHNIGAVGEITVGVKENFIKIEEEAQRKGLRVNEGKTKYMHVCRNTARGRVRQNVTMDLYNAGRD